MLGNLFHTVFYKPLYNALILIIDILPTQDVGVAVIILTILVSVIILPITLKAVRTQVKMKLIEPKLKEIQKKYKDNREQQAIEMMSLYREEKVNPFSSILLLLVQLPFIFALYYIFARGGLPVVNPEHLYSFVPTPTEINVYFLGLTDVTSKNLLLAIIAGAAQFFQSHILLSGRPKKAEEDEEAKEKDKKEAPSFQEELAKSMNINMRFVFPVIIGVIAYSFTGVVAIYFTVRSIVTVIQEVFVKRRIRQDSNNEK